MIWLTFGRPAINATSEKATKTASGSANKSLNLTGAAFLFRAACSRCSGPGKLARALGSSMDVDQVVDLSKGLLTPVIAIVTAYVAWQQWKTNQQKLIWDRYDRRLRVYEEVNKILLVIRDAKASYDDLLRFRSTVSEADFLFGPEIVAHIDEIYQRGVKLQCWTRQYRDSTQAIPDGYDHKKVCDGMHQELTWLSAQLDPTKEKFRKYLDVSK